MIYITGDTHGKFDRIRDFCINNNTTQDDIMIILGDVGLNYYGNYNGDFYIKQKVSEIPITLFCVHGNHEQRPSNIKTYDKKLWNGGYVWYESSFKNILFADDGEIFNINGKSIAVCGGAFSPDGAYRVSKGWGFWEDEQPSDEIKVKFVKNLSKYDNIDVILTHTCPIKYEPTECFLPIFKNIYIDNSTEIWLDTIEDNIIYNKWYCGHYHTNKKIDKLHFLFEDIVEFL